MRDAVSAALSSLTPAMIFPVAVIFFLTVFFLYYIKIVKPAAGTGEWVKMRVAAEKRRQTFFDDRYPLEKSDALPIIIITAVFILLALFNLGSTAPVNVLAEVQERTPGHTHTDNLYFDEIYFVRTAAEHIAAAGQHDEDIRIYEWTHPPLGKNMIAASIIIFGESPFGWRLIGALCGAVMVLVMYIFIKNMFGKTAIAACGALLLGFDFMRFVQSRIGTIDTYAVLFILLAYYFMYRYITTDPDAALKKSLPALALSGLFFGLSFAVKWTGFYAGAGLLIIYIIRFVRLHAYYDKKKKRGFPAYFIQTIAFTFLFFIVLPACIYYLNYIPYGWARNMTLEGGMLWSTDYFKMLWSNQKSMFHYHSKLDATHGGSSVWWMWLFNIKPILYVNSHADGLRATYGAFGNPVLYWSGLAAMVTMGIRVFKYRDRKALFILIGYLAQLLPWVAVTRVLFAYHYLPGTLFLVLALAHILDTVYEREKNRRKGYVYGLTAVTGAAFVMFYPMLAGMYLPDWYYTYFLKWLPSWPF